MIQKARLRGEVDDLLRMLQEARTDLEPAVEAGLDLGAKLRDAAREIGDSSSGSWVGWHSRMYYGDYHQPPVEESWDSEWGGIYGPRQGWQERSQMDVQAVIEARAGVGLADVAAEADRARIKCQPLHQEVVTVLSPVCDLAGLEREAELLSEMETIDWITSPTAFLQALAPRQMMSRDSHALSQGMQAPLHLNVEASIVSNTSTLSTCRKFLDDAIRLCRQVKSKLAALPDARPLDLRASESAADPNLVRQLVWRSAALFSLLAVAIVGGVIVALRGPVDGRLLTAVVIVIAALALAGLYALLVNRAHAGRALGMAGAVGGAVATLDQLLA